MADATPLELRVHSSGELLRPDDLRVDRAWLVRAGFLARYRELTRAKYATTIDQWFAWCAEHGLDPLEVQRAHVELYGRWLEEVRGLAPGTVAGKISTVAVFYKVAVMDGYLTVSPAQFVRRPKVDTVSKTTWLTEHQLPRPT